MKKAISMFLMMALAVAVVGCGKSSDVSSTSETSSAAEEEKEAEPEEVAEETTDGYDGYEEGRMGDTMETYFFDYTVNSAYVCSDYAGYTPEEGNELLVANVTVKNVHKESIEMYDTDFQAQWGGEGDYDFSVPITYDGTMEGLPTISEDQLPGIYELAVNQEVTGDLVFEVPEGYKDFSVSYMEAFSDDTTGVTYFVYFTADRED